MAASSRLRPVLLGAALVLVGACAEEAPDRTVEADADLPGDAFPRAVRELVFIGELDGEILGVWFTFTAEERNAGLNRRVVGWISHNGAWERFLEVERPGGVARGIWRIVPMGNLRVRVGGAAEIEELIYARHDDEFRIAIQEVRSGWQRVDPSRFRVMTATLTTGDRQIPGRMIEAQHQRAPSHDRSEQPTRIDWVFLTDGGNRDLFLATPSGTRGEASGGAGWLRDGEDEHGFDRLAVRWDEVTAVEQARRDIPLRWVFSAPDLDEVVVEPSSYDVVIGPERRGRRVTDVRYTVTAGLEGVTWRGVARYERE